ncbi:MAG: DUF4143 domain-containing protein, partial [Planctomycetes bacterium]|nr:DUF4143 domain-containing protein [Planctomycetota bacterium]
PKLGASWEGFALEQVLQRVGSSNAYFWATHGGAELDLMVTLDGKRYGIELKYGDAPRSTRSMRVAIHDLGLERVVIVHPGRESYRIDQRIEALSILHVGRLFAVVGAGRS